MLKTKESESYPVFNNKIGNHEKLSPLLRLRNICIALDTQDYDSRKTIKQYMKSNWRNTNFAKLTKPNAKKLANEYNYYGYLRSDFYKNRKGYGKNLKYSLGLYLRGNEYYSHHVMQSLEVDILKQMEELRYGIGWQIPENFERLDSLRITTPFDIQRVNDKAHKEDWKGLPFDELVQGSEYRNIDRLYELNNLTRVHHAIRYTSKVAYYRNMADYKRGREIVTTIGKYLARFSDYLGMTDKQVKLITDNFLTTFKGFGDLKLSYIEGRLPLNATQHQIEKQQELWIDSYRKDNTAKGDYYFQSCMSDKSCVGAYASPQSDVRLALLKNSHGLIYARAIIRTGNKDQNERSEKGYIRIYPSPSENRVGTFMKQLLNADGYENKVNFNYCIFDAIWLENSDCFKAPYIDGQDHETLGEKFRYAQETDIEGREYLEVCENQTDHYLENTNGRTNQYDDEDEDDEDYTWCCECDERVHYDDTYNDDDDRTYCSSCYDSSVVKYAEPYFAEVSNNKNPFNITDKVWRGSFNVYTGAEDRHTFREFYDSGSMDEFQYYQIPFLRDVTSLESTGQRDEILHSLGLGTCVFSRENDREDIKEDDTSVFNLDQMMLTKYGYVNESTIWGSKKWKEVGSPKLSEFQSVYYPTRKTILKPFDISTYSGVSSDVKGFYLYQLEIYMYEDKDVKQLPNGKTCAKDNPDFFYIY